MRIEVDRRTWLRGEGSSNSYLYRPIDGKMCCLGFVSRAIDIPVACLDYQKTPTAMKRINDDKFPKLFTSPEFQQFFESDRVRHELAMVINDAQLGDDVDASYDKWRTILDACDTKLVNYKLVSEAQRESLLIEVLAPLGIDLVFTHC